MSRLNDQITRARQILTDAIAEHQPIAIFAAFSGGNDSIVSTHFAMGEVPSCRALHINTGIGIPATREHVRQVCRQYGWELIEERTPESYEDLVLGKVNGFPGGFPGPAMHKVMYNRLKERALRAVIHRSKSGHPRSARVLIISGIRHDESAARTGYQRALSRVGSQVWVNPFYWATHQDFGDYRERFRLPRNPVKDLVGISGECLCGSYAEKGELLLIEMTCPATGAYLRDLERRVRAVGFPWGYEDRPPSWWVQERHGQTFLFAMADDPDDEPGDPEFRPMCQSCEKVRIIQTN